MKKGWKMKLPINVLHAKNRALKSQSPWGQKILVAALGVVYMLTGYRLKGKLKVLRNVCVRLTIQYAIC